MIYLKTPTSELTPRQIRRVVCETILWCETHLGTKRKKTPLKVQVRFSSSPNYGTYDSEKNILKVCHNICENVKMVIMTTIHEYTHTIQDLRSYDKIFKKVGYDKHPFEVEARSNEKLYSICWKEIKQTL